MADAGIRSATPAPLRMASRRIMRLLLKESIASLVWAAAMAAVVFLDLGRINGRIDGHLATLLTIYAAGGALAFPAAAVLTRGTVGSRGGAVRFLAACVILGLVTIAATALVYLLRDVALIVHPGDIARPRVIVHRLLDFAFTLAEFCVLGLRLYFPYGLAALLPGAAWLAWRAR